MTGYWQLVPEALVIATAIVALFGDVLSRRGDRAVAYLGAGVSLGAAVLVIVGARSQLLWGGMLVFDGLARYARAAIALLGAVWLLWVAGRGLGRQRMHEAVALALVSVAGGMLLASAGELMTFFLAVEISTMPAYVLVGYRRRDVAGLEGTLKYFLLSLLTSMVMLYGLSFLYGLSGSTLYANVTKAAPSTLATTAAVLVLVGLFAKLSAAPFHYWAPDAYAGASAASVAFVSTVPKLAGTVAAVRLITFLPVPVALVAAVVAVAAAASMLLGNLAALSQTDVRRLMAYSGVAHTGYVLVAVAALGSAANAGGTAVFYALAYAVPSMAIMLVAAEEGAGLERFGDLVTRRPAVAWSLVALLLSLVGIPPFAGFFGKLYVFGAAIGAHLTWLVVVAVVASVISAAYYFRIVRAMFFGPPKGAAAQPTERTTVAGEADRGDTQAASSQVVPSGVQLHHSVVLPEDAAPDPPGRSVAASVALWACLVATVALGVFAHVPSA